MPSVFRITQWLARVLDSLVRVSRRVARVIQSVDHIRIEMPHSAYAPRQSAPHSAESEPVERNTSTLLQRAQVRSEASPRSTFRPSHRATVTLPGKRQATFRPSLWQNSSIGRAITNWKVHWDRLPQLNINWFSVTLAFTPQRFHVLIYSLFKVLFNFPSRYLFAIGLTTVFSFRWDLPPTLSCIPKQLDSNLILWLAQLAIWASHLLWVETLSNALKLALRCPSH